MEPDHFEIRIPVEPSDIDQFGHVNNVVYLRWVQDAAVAHWKSTAPPAAQAAIAWVVVRHEVDYRRPAMPGDEIVARTWVGRASRDIFERFTQLRRGSDNKILAKARTLWCPVDPRTGKYRRVDPEIRERFSTSGELSTLAPPTL